jgi:hypothetical protein
MKEQNVLARKIIEELAGIRDELKEIKYFLKDKGS